MTGTYSPYLVALSLLVACIASYTALNLAARVTSSRGARGWLVGGACAMGVGIWSMHFIGMLAFSLPIPISYHIPVTLLSLAIAIGVSGFALALASGEALALKRLLLGGLVMGAGICAMHYTGMAAMEMSPSIRYDAIRFAASVIIAVAASIAALWIAYRLRHGDSHRVALARMGAACVMGLAITGMHYTGMSAALFAPDTICTSPSDNVDNTWLAAIIAAFTLGILGVALALSILDGRIGRLVESLQEANAELHHRATHDALSGLPNRMLLQDRIRQALRHAERTSQPFALIFLDLDQFKTVNDSLGLHMGDRLLRFVAERLRRCVCAEDTVARTGGDDFVIVLNEAGDAAGAATVAQKVLATLAAPFRLDEHHVRISASAGVVMFPHDGANVDDLLSNASAALLHAKQNGRGTCEFFAPAMNAIARQRLEVENGLRRALENNELELHYQPKIDIASARIVGMEALVRWRHPERGLVPPAQFIALAEENGLIVPIGTWVLATACRQNKAWQAAGLPQLRVAVNLSANQFRQKDLVAAVARVLRDAELEPRFLELELTESTVMQNADEAARVLERLHETGVHISIDDFGTGYSSLSYLKRFPLDKLKIDRSFVHDINANANDAAIVTAIISLAHSLHIKVIAEGVETAEQLALLRSLGCDQYQGNYCSPPVPAEKFVALLRSLSARSKTSTQAPVTA